MDYLIRKSDGSIIEVFPGGATKVKLPEQTGGDVVFVGDEHPIELGEVFEIEAVESVVAVEEELGEDGEVIVEAVEAVAAVEYVAPVPAPYLLIKATEVDETVDAATQKRGPTTTEIDVAAKTVTVTRTTVAKDAADLLNDVYAKRQASIANGGYGTDPEQFEILGEQGIGAYQQHIAAVKARHQKP
jgi:hypothetical protein